jgi:hypothetical protein
MRNEVWKDVVNYEGDYLVSNFGRIRRISRASGTTVGLILKPKHIRKYLTVCLYKNKLGRNFFVHRLVTSAFIGNLPSNYQVNHKYGNGNNNNLNNLEYVTPKQNINHAHLKGLMPSQKGENNPQAKLRKCDVLKIRLMAEKFNTNHRVLANRFCISQPCVTLIVNRKRWLHI